MKIQWFRMKNTEQGIRTMGTKDLRKWFVIASLVVLLGVATYAGYQLTDAFATPASKANKPLASASAPKASDLLSAAPSATAKVVDTSAPKGISSLSEFRSERERTRNEMIEQLDAMVANASISAETRKDAEAQKLQLLDCMEKEVTLEGLLAAKGFAGAVVTVHPGSVNIIINTPELTDTQATRILEMTLRETHENVDNIKIHPIK